MPASVCTSAQSVDIPVQKRGTGGTLIQGGTAHRGRGHHSVIVRAAHVIPALRAYQLAMVAGEPVPAGGAHLAMMIDVSAPPPERTACEIIRKIGIEGYWAAAATCPTD